MNFFGQNLLQIQITLPLFMLLKLVQLFSTHVITNSIIIKECNTIKAFYNRRNQRSMNKQNKGQQSLNQSKIPIESLQTPSSAIKSPNLLLSDKNPILTNASHSYTNLKPQFDFSIKNQGKFFNQEGPPQLSSTANTFNSKFKPNLSCFAFNAKSSTIRYESKDSKYSKTSSDFSFGGHKISKFNSKKQCKKDQKDYRRMTEDTHVPSFIKKKEIDAFQQQKRQRKQRNSGRKGSMIKSAIMIEQDLVLDKQQDQKNEGMIVGIEICSQQPHGPMKKYTIKDLNSKGQRKVDTKGVSEVHLSQLQNTQQDLFQHIQQLNHQAKKLSIENSIPKSSFSKLDAKLQQSFSKFTEHQMSKFPKLQDFELGQMLGKGANGSVRIARHKPSGFFLAIKNYSKKFVSENLARFTENIRLQMACKHPNIATLYGFFLQNDDFYLLMELCIDIDLNGQAKYIRKSIKDTKEVIRGIARGIMYLHNNQIIHRDIKLQNVLMSHQMPKITDFDLSVYQNNPVQQRTTFCGSPAYFSPEMLTNASYNNKADLWSFGVLCYQLICGYYPFETSNYSDTMENIKFQQPKPYPENLSKDAKSFISIMLIKNPDDRAGIKEVMAHEYLKNQEKNNKNQFNM